MAPGQPKAGVPRTAERSFKCLHEHDPEFELDGGMSPELLRAIDDAKFESFRVFRDRIYIAEELEWADMLGAWDTAVTNFEKAEDPEGRNFAERFNKISNALVRMAMRPNRQRPVSRFAIRRILDKI